MKKIVLFLITICMAVSMGAANKTFTLVIDAGHGGGDTGAVGAISKEKNLTLKFALAFGRLVEQNCPDVRVIYTRKTDKFVELYRRAEIANQNKADLFISIHINALPKGRIARGFQTYTLGTSKRTGKKTGVFENLEVAKRENAVIFLEKDYKQTYQGYDPNSPESDIMFEFIQDKNMENSIELAKYMQRYVCAATGRQDLGAQQDNLAVLRLSSMPGALLELGFISTRDEETFMNSSAAEGMYARGIFNAFLAYRKRHGGNLTIPYQTVDPLPVEKAVERSDEKPVEQPMDSEPAAQAIELPAIEQMPVEKKPSGISQDAVAKPAPAPVKTIVEPVFKVQILTSSTKLKPGAALLKGRKDADFYREGGVYKYTLGSSVNYNEIYRLRKEVLDKFPQAFIIAFKNGEKMNVQTAIQEFKNNKARK